MDRRSFYHIFAFTDEEDTAMQNSGMCPNFSDGTRKTIVGVKPPKKAPKSKK